MNSSQKPLVKADDGAKRISKKSLKPISWNVVGIFSKDKRNAN
jgi:hypothetical protein